MKKSVKKMTKRRKLNNAGSVLVSVIVVIAFLTMIATTMLYITGMNYQMKQTDYMNKKSFYKAEEALDTLNAVLVEDMSEAFEHAYTEAMVQYAYLEDDTRQAAFNGAFLDYLDEKWRVEKETAEASGLTLKDVLVERVSNEYPEYEKYFVDAQAGEPTIDIANDRANGRFIITNIRVRYTENGYSSFICTDIALCVPELDLTKGGSENGTWEKPDPAAGPERETVVLSDFIIYMNWTKY